MLRFLFLKEDPLVYDPLVIRAVFSFMLLLILFLSFFKDFSERIIYMNYMVFCFYSFHGLVLIAKNGFAVSYILEYILLIIIICLSFKDKVHINLYLSIIFSAYSIACFVFLPSVAEIVIYTGLLAIFCIAILLFFDFRIDIENRLKSREALLNKVFNEAPDALFLVDPSKGSVFNPNARTESIFNNKKPIESFTEIFKGGLDENKLKLYKRLIKTEGSVVDEIEFIRDSGLNSFWGSLAITPTYLYGKNQWLIRISDISDRIKDKKAIEENRKILNEVINLLPHQVYVKDSKGKFLLVNQAVAEIYGRKADELIGKSDFDLFAKAQAEKLRKLEMEVLVNNKTIINPEEKYLSKGGKIKYVHTTKMPFYLNEKNEVGILGVNLDITEAKEAERVIKESEAKYKMLMEQASDGIVISDKDEQILEANAKACEIFGYSIEELIKLRIRDLADLDFNPDIPQMNLSSSVILERKFKKKNGNLITVEVSAKRLPDGRHQAIIRDITERKRLEKILTESERKFRALIENSSDIIAILNKDFEFTFISNSVERILGYIPRKIHGRQLLDFIDAEDQKKVLTLLKSTFQQPGQATAIEEINWQQEKGKEPRCLETVAFNLLNDPVINGIILNCHDITKRKLTESELLTTNFELDSFVYKASHDLKAPLRSIMGLIKLAGLETKDDIQVKYLQMMSKSVSSLDQFIKDLTQFSRNSRMEVEAKKVNFDEIVSEALLNLKFLENADKVKINKNIQNSVNFYSDLTRITTIINNLISNAYKYHRFENNNPYINIEIKTDHDQAFISIEDNGQGIDPNYIDHIFEMFYRASETSYGSGLGLYIVKSAVTRLNGEIKVNSVLNQGSVFTVVLPNLVNGIEK